ncbi:MAG: hypothetical protein ABIY55_20295, partial [Kofleriaceae bacterium]
MTAAAVLGRAGRRLQRYPILAVTALFAVVLGLVLSGVFAGLATAPAAFNKPIAIVACVLYGLLAVLAVFVATRWRRRRRLLLIAGGTVVAALIGAELWARSDIAVPDTLGFKFIHSPRFHHAHPPGHRLFILKDDENRATFATLNADGLRSDRTREDFVKLGKRVAVLGDSFAFGFKVDQPYAFPQVLERTLRERYGKADLGVLNAGTTSYSPYLEHRLLDDVVAGYHPDVVVLLLDATDIGDDIFYARLDHAGGEGGFGPSSIWLANGATVFDHSALVQRLQPISGFAGAVLLHPFAAAVTPMAIGGSLNLDFEGGNEPSRFFIFRYPLDKTRRFFDATFANITATARSAQAMGAAFVLVVAPRFQHWNRKECPDNWEHGEYKLDEPYQDEYLRYFEERK